MADWAANLGNALGGDSEESYQKGRAMGANTEEALANARRRVMENDAIARGEKDLVAADVAPDLARVMANSVAAGGRPEDPIQAMLKNQEFNFRAKAGDPNVPLDIGQRALLGVASGPTEPVYEEGGHLFNKFQTPTDVSAMPATTQGGGTSAQLQLIRELETREQQIRHDPNFHFTPLQAMGIARESQHLTDMGGGVPGVVDFRSSLGLSDGSAQPPRAFGASGATPAPTGPVATTPTAAPATTVTDVARNAAAVASAKEQGQQQGLAAVKLPEALSDLDNMQANIQRLVSKPGFDSIYGPRVGTDIGQAVTQFASGDASNAAADRQQLAANAFVISIVKNRGQGQLSNAEGLKFTDAFTRATNSHITPEEARQAWAEASTYIDKIKARLKVSAGKPFFAADGETPLYGTGGAPQGAAPAAPAAAAPAAGQVKMIGGKKYVKTGPGPNDWAEDDGT